MRVHLRLFWFVLLSFTALTLLSGCDTLRQIQQQNMAAICNQDAAYAAGVNDGKANAPMRSYYNAACPSNLNAAYRQGYQFGLSHGGQIAGIANLLVPRTQQQCVNTIGGRVCGYNCAKTTSGSARCASTPDQRCIASDFGDIACGYQCVKSFDKVKCATSPGDNCVKTDFGDVKCGKNCRIESINIRCDIER